MKYKKKRQKTNDKYLKMGYWFCLFVFFLSEDRMKIYVMIVMWIPVCGMIAMECVKVQWIVYGNKRQNGKVFENTNEQKPFCKWSIKKTQFRWCP